MTVEHHSAGFRPKTDESPTKSPNKMREPTHANSLSQISSVEESSPKKLGSTSIINGGDKSATNLNNHFRPGLQARNQKIKNNLREQEKKLKLLEDQNKRTNKMIMQFNNREDPFQELQSAEPLPESPLIREMKREKVVKPKITDFDLMEIVGIGNFGKVHKAYNKRTEKVVALKVLKKESVAAMKHVDHIINEREVLQYLSDRNR
jgi:hypothetical protein